MLPAECLGCSFLVVDSILKENDFLIRLEEGLEIFENSVEKVEFNSNEYKIGLRKGDRLTFRDGIKLEFLIHDPCEYRAEDFIKIRGKLSYFFDTNRFWLCFFSNF